MTEMETLGPLGVAGLVAAGAAAGALVTWLLMRGRLAGQAQLLDSFKALAADTLHQNSAAFLTLADSQLRQREEATVSAFSQKAASIDSLVRPVQETLQKLDAQLQALEVKREGAYRELMEMVSASASTQTQLRAETGQLLQALRAPTARGRWGEIQLQRLLEMTGMSTHARDFTAQTTLAGDDGALRPDVIVALPGGRCVVIDSKVPLNAWLDALQNPESAAQAAAMKKHAQQLRSHVKSLGSKAYWEQVEGTPDFVVLFLPGEHFLGAALDADSELMEYSANQKVILATPMTLIALLRTIAHGWRQESLRDNVRQVADMGRRLHAALGVFSGQMGQLGQKLSGAVESYNKTVTTLERNVLGAARQLSAFGAAEEGTLEPPDLLERQPRVLDAKNDAA